MADRKEDDYGVSAVALESLERNFVEVMKELSAEDNLERFKLEYEKLHRALKKSHESEKRLIKKCQELNQEITSNAAKVQSALQMSQDDETTIASLRKEIEKAWKMVDGAHEKEARAKDTIQQLKKEVSRLTTLVEQGAGLTLGHESNLQDLIEDKKELSKERDSSKLKVTQLVHELKEVSEKLKKMQAEQDHSEVEFQSKTNQYAQIWKEFDNEQRQKEISERKVQEYHATIDKKIKELDTAKVALSGRQAEQERLEKQAKEELDVVNKLTQNYEQTQREVQQQKESLNQTDLQNSQLKSEVPIRQGEVEKKAQEVVSSENSLQRVNKTVEEQNGAITKLIAERDELNVRGSEQAKQIRQLLESVEEHQHSLDELERHLKEKVREKNLTVTINVREENERVKLEGSKVIEQGKNRSLAQELEANLVINEKLRKDIFLLEQQQQKYFQEAHAATNRHHQALEQVRLGKERAAQLTIELEDAEKKLKNQQSMYEQVRSDRALYKKSLNEAQTEINDMLRKFKLMDHHVKQVKDELATKERMLCMAHATHKQLGKDIEVSTQKVNNLKEDYSHAKGRGDALADEIKQLAQIISDCDTEKAKQQMKFNSVTNERNILATQLIRRNEELTILYEKIRIQHSTLHKGESQYRDRLVDIRMLREKVHELRLGLRVALARIRNVEEMKRHVTTLQRQLMQERTKVKALYEELQNPMNVHRWRKLEGSDPQEMENLLKIHTLQKRLIAKTEECVAKDKLIGDAEGEYTQLKNILSRQPGPEVAEQLNVYHDNIMKRVAQIQRMESELDSTCITSAEYKSDVDKLSQELVDVKHKFFELKSKNALLSREKKLAVDAGGVSPLLPAGQQLGQDIAGKVLQGSNNFMISHPPAQPRFAGGGFSLSQ